jgi:hypothetical protein
MDGRSYRIVIDLDATDGPPHGRISVDGARQHCFYGWMDLTARLESLMRRPVRRAERKSSAEGFKAHY